MPNTHTTLASLFNDIADAIRSKDGTSAEIVADTFPDRISAIDTDPSSDATINSNGQLLSGVTAYGQGVKYTGTIPTKTSSDLSASGDTVTVPAGYYASQVTKSVATGSATTPATTVSPSVSSVSFAYNSTNGNFDVTGSGSTTKSVTPTVSAGYVSAGTAGTITGSASVAATAPKIAGSVSISGTKMYTPTITRTAKPSGDTWTDAASGAATTTKPTSGVYVQVNTAKNSGNVTAGATISTAGYGTLSAHGISGSGNVEVGANASSNTYVPITTGTITNNTTLPSGSTSSGTINRGSYIKIGAGYNTSDKYYLAQGDAHSSYTPSSTYFKTSTSGAVSGAKINANQYATSDYYVKSGSATTPATSVTAGDANSSSVATSTGIVSITTKAATQNVTPTVSAGWVASGTAGTITVPSKTYTYQLPTTKAASTITPGTTNQTIAAGTYLTGIQTISGDADLVASNIKSGVNIFGVTGTFTNDATATAADIVSGKTAYISSGKATGTLAIYDGTVIVN